ncbi:MAG: ScyD/ScyE family protein, partial [Deinococcota bacterium]|nr:ScyD/ScyE family protein [Deinococcota bacterium]
NVWVVDSGTGGDETFEMTDPQTGETATLTAGATSRILRISPDGEQTEITRLPSLTWPLGIEGGARLAFIDGTLYATSGFWIEYVGPEPMPLMATVVRLENDEVIQVADTWAFEDEHNPDGFIKESHPYGIAAGPDGHLWVADAGANTLLRIDPESGEIDLVTVFEGIESPLPNPARGGAMESDPVPTGITVGPDGTVYVALLPGFPFLPGSGKIVTVTAEGEVGDYATGLTLITDIRAGPDGNLYAVQIGQFTEEGPMPNSGAVLRIQDGEATEVLSELPFPTAIAFNQEGDAYVTIHGAFGPGGAVVRYDGFVDGTSAP